MSKELTALITIRLTDRERALIEQLAVENDRPFSAEVRRAIRIYIEDHARAS